MKILIIGAHPTDIVDLAGGTALLHSRNGDEVIGCAVTNGIYSHVVGLETDSRDEMKKWKTIKKMETKEACAEVGINTVAFLNLADEPLVTNKPNIEKIRDIICRTKPDTIITHHPNEYAHWDHAEAGKMVCRAIKGAIKYPSKQKHYVPNVYFFGVQSRPESARIGFNPLPPTVLVDVTEVMQTKLAALFNFASQGLNDMDALWRRADSFESETGRADGIRYAEAFISYYPIKKKLLPESINTSFYTNKEVS